jgi:ankyrin repeat protein
MKILELLIAGKIHDTIDLNELFNNYNVNEIKDDENNSALFYAIENDDKRLIDFLLLKGVNVNHKNEHEITALEIAISKGNLEIVKLLYQNNARLENQYDISELHIASSTGNVEIVKYFLDKNLDVDSKDIRGITPLYLAIQENHLDVAKLLVKNLADINFEDENGYNLLLCAVGEGHLGIVKYLIEEHNEIFESKILESIDLASAYNFKEIKNYLESKYLN